MPLSNIFCIEIGGACVFQMEQYKTKFLDELSSQQVVDRLNKFSNACLKDVSYDVDDAVKDLLDVVFGVAEATL